ncbi:MAG: hypothetical protein HW421_2339 [Ignavibacteria bacterium]|nr:hypothetical protein [Ignavibacteria bacterium]
MKLEKKENLSFLKIQESPPRTVMEIPSNEGMF